MDEHGGTRISAVMTAIRQRIGARVLTPGDRLPSIRALATTMQVSTSTVVEAFERLAAEGVIRSRPGSGFYVAGQLAPLSLAEIGPRLAAFDGLDRVVHIGSFSKTLSASARCGFVAARSDWIDGLADLKIATSFGGGRLAAELVLHVPRDGSYRKHVEGLRERLSGAMIEVGARLRAVGIVPWLEPEAGMFLWRRLPDGIDAAELAREALAADIVLAPGNAFSLSQSAHGFLRFNVAQSLDDRLCDVPRAAIRRQGRERRYGCGGWVC